MQIEYIPICDGKAVVKEKIFVFQYFWKMKDLSVCNFTEIFL